MSSKSLAKLKNLEVHMLSALIRETLKQFVGVVFDAYNVEKYNAVSLTKISKSFFANNDIDISKILNETKNLYDLCCQDIHLSSTFSTMLLPQVSLGKWVDFVKELLKVREKNAIQYDIKAMLNFFIFINI
jgi:hypothetical protein